jgi:hypothetical protein
MVDPQRDNLVNWLLELRAAEKEPRRKQMYLDVVTELFLQWFEADQLDPFRHFPPPRLV